MVTNWQPQMRNGVPQGCVNMTLKAVPGAPIKDHALYKYTLALEGHTASSRLSFVSVCAELVHAFAVYVILLAFLAIKSYHHDCSGTFI